MATLIYGQVQWKNAWGGIFLSILGSLAWDDIIRTVVLGMLGTAVSFFVSALLGRLFKKKRGIAKSRSKHR